MGIAALLQALEAAMGEVDMEALRGKRVAVDGYCWLHKATYSCAWELALGEHTTKYLSFCAAMLDMLSHFGVTPIVVLDGGPLPSKRAEEEDRRARREENLRAGMEALRSGNRPAALACFQKAVDVTPRMAQAFEALLRSRGVQFIVAPFEADAQLAFLATTGRVDAVVTEDSDMVPYGVQCSIFKLTRTGQGRVLRLQDVFAKTEFRTFSQPMLRQACILSGCDYLPSPSGMGLKTAIKLIRKHRDAPRALRALRLDSNFRFPPDYEEAFRRAELTFRHQQVFDPDARKAVPLTPLPDGVEWESLEPFLGARVPDDVAAGIADGLLDPITRAAFPPLPSAAPAATSSTTLRRSLPARPGLPVPAQRNTLLNYFHHETTPMRHPERTESEPSPLVLRKSKQASKQFNPPRSGATSAAAPASASASAPSTQQRTAAGAFVVKSRFFPRMSQGCDVIAPNRGAAISSAVVPTATRSVSSVSVSPAEVEEDEDVAEEISDPDSPVQDAAAAATATDFGEEDELVGEEESLGEIGAPQQERPGYRSEFLATPGRLTLPLGHRGAMVLAPPALDAFVYTSGDSNDAQAASRDASETLPPTLELFSASRKQPQPPPPPPPPPPPQSSPSPPPARPATGSIADRLASFLFDPSEVFPRIFYPQPQPSQSSQQSQNRQPSAESEDEEDSSSPPPCKMQNRSSPPRLLF